MSYSLCASILLGDSSQEEGRSATNIPHSRTPIATYITYYIISNSGESYGGSFQALLHVRQGFLSVRPIPSFCSLPRPFDFGFDTLSIMPKGKILPRPIKCSLFTIEGFYLSCTGLLFSVSESCMNLGQST